MADVDPDDMSWTVHLGGAPEVSGSIMSFSRRRVERRWFDHTDHCPLCDSHLIFEGVLPSGTDDHSRVACSSRSCVCASGLKILSECLVIDGEIIHRYEPGDWTRLRRVTQRPDESEQGYWNFFGSSPDDHARLHGELDVFCRLREGPNGRHHVSEWLDWTDRIPLAMTLDGHQHHRLMRGRRDDLVMLCCPLYAITDVEMSQIAAHRLSDRMDEEQMRLFVNVLNEYPLSTCEVADNTVFVDVRHQPPLASWRARGVKFGTYRIPVNLASDESREADRKFWSQYTEAPWLRSPRD